MLRDTSRADIMRDARTPALNTTPTEQPVLESARLLLRPYTLADAANVQRLAGDPRIADTTTNIPHPYPDGAAERWIESLAPAFAEGRRITFAVTLRETAELIGSVALHTIFRDHARAELGYWIAVGHWGQGYATEATCRLMAYAREGQGITRIISRCLARNPASSRVMEKAGMHREGLLIAHERKHATFEDVVLYGLTFPERYDAG